MFRNEKKYARKMSEIRSSIQSWQKKKVELKAEITSAQNKESHEGDSPVLWFTPFGVVGVVPRGSNRCRCCRNDKVAELEAELKHFEQKIASAKRSLLTLEDKIEQIRKLKNNLIKDLAKPAKNAQNVDMEAMKKNSTKANKFQKRFRKSKKPGRA